MSVLHRIRRWVANPWGKPRFLVLFTIAYMVWAIVPILVAIRFSFNEGRSRSTAQGWSTRWYWDDPDLSVWNDPTLREAVFQSLQLAAFAMLIAVPIGVLLALGLTRWRGRGSGSARLVALLPIVTPEIVMGTALFLTFVHLLRFVELGTTAQVIGHVTFSISFVLIIVRGRLLSIGPEYEEAAMDLGAAPRQALRMVLLPLLAPAIFASFMIVFAISIDDFVISAFLSADASTETVPIKIYSNARGAPTPALNAVATVMLVVSLLAVGLAALVVRAIQRARGERTRTVQDFAELNV
ncbi:MAG TPA: ABC transporter permease [Gaiellaceae bacterium]|nr:ABC transporter permease [Gaiellaceae bacterium]